MPPCVAAARANGFVVAFLPSLRALRPANADLFDALFVLLFVEANGLLAAAKGFVDCVVELDPKMLDRCDVDAVANGLLVVVDVSPNKEDEAANGLLFYSFCNDFSELKKKNEKK